MVALPRSVEPRRGVHTGRARRAAAGTRGARRTTATLTLRALEPLSRAERSDVLAEAERAMLLVADDADAHVVTFAD